MLANLLAKGEMALLALSCTILNGNPAVCKIIAVKCEATECLQTH